MRAPVRSRSYGVSNPTATHTRSASCDEVACKAHAGGFSVIADEATTEGQARLKALADHNVVNGRRFTRTQVGTVHTFTFPPGERCFAQHRVPVDRPQFHTITHIGARRSVGPDEWLDDFDGHLTTLRKQAGQ